MERLLSPRITVIVVCVLGIIAVTLWLRDFSGKDAWLCVDGQWVRHGNPSSSAPATPCRKVENVSSSALPIPPAPVAGNREPMKSFEDAEISLQYPDWPALNPKAMLEPTLNKVAVSNDGCAFVVTARALPADEEFRAALERLLSDQIAQANVRLLFKEIGDATSHVEGEFSVGGKQVHTSQYGYLTKGRQLYSVVFAAEKSNFETACSPVIPSVIQSVKVK